MYPQLFNQASRLAPMLSRILSRGGSFATPFWKTQQIDTPDVNAQPMPPQGQPAGPQVPISQSNYSPPAPPLTPNQRVAGGQSMFPMGSMPILSGPSTPSPLDSAQWPAGPVGAPSAPTHASVPMPQARPAEAPQAQPDMSFFQRNAAMMQDPMTGQFIDPTAAAKAVRGPDLIAKMMGYLHNKDIG